MTEELERIPPADAGFDQLDSELTEAIEAAKCGPRRTMFPTRLVMVDANTLAMYSYYVARATPATYRQAMGSLHGRALDDAPEMARLFRSPECRADIESAARSCAFDRLAQDAAAAEAMAAYEKEIAEQLASWTDAEIAATAREFLALLALVDRQAAARGRQIAARQAAAERAAAEARAAKEAADAEADAAETDRLLTEALQRHGLPGNIRTGIFVEQQRDRLQLLAVARRRLTTTTSDVVRVGRGGERKAYNPKHLANAIADATVEELRQVIGAVDAVEQGDGRWS